MASWGSYVFELCRINANQGLTAEIDWNYTSWSRRCRKILIGLVVRGAKTVVVRGKNRILTRNRKKPEMTVPISKVGKKVIHANPKLFQPYLRRNRKLSKFPMPGPSCANKVGHGCYRKSMKLTRLSAQNARGQCRLWR